MRRKSKNKPIELQKVIGKGYNTIWNDKHFWRVIKGSRGSKKSSTIALNTIFRMMQYPWANTIVLRRYGYTNRTSTFQQLVWAINRLGVADYWAINNSAPKLTYKPTGQVIIFAGLDDPLKLTSTTVAVGHLSWAWLDEAYEFESWENIQTFAESIRGVYDAPDFFKQITITFNPWSETHWLKKQFFDKTGSVEPDMIYSTTTTYRANEWLDEQDISRYEALRTTDPRRADIVLDGKWGVSDGLVYEGIFDVHEFEVPTNLPIIAGVDFGWTNDPTVVLKLAIDLPNREIWIIDEWYKKNQLTTQIGTAIKMMGLADTQITADRQDGRVINELRNMGIPKITNAMKGTGSVESGVMYIKQYKIHILPKLTHTIEEFNLYAFDKDKTGKFMNKPIDANNHVMDALRYAVEPYMLRDKKRSNGTALAERMKGIV